MPKQIKGNANRKPPEPSDSHAEIEEWIDGRLMPGLVPIVKALDTSIRALVPGVHYAVKFKRAFYGLPNLGWLIEIAPYDVSVNVVFLGGADFTPAPMLGTTDRTRYVKISSEEEAKAPQLLDWLEQAGRTAGWR